MNYYSTDFTLGILGGGQLGKMLLYATRKWDICTHVLDPNPEAPCKISCNHFEEGDLMDFDTVYNFGKQVDVLTIEIEGVNVEALDKLEKEGIKVYPSAQTLRRIQDKGVQKQFYEKHGIPTSPFRIFNDKESLQRAVSEEEISLPFVWKSCKGGYDGRGVHIITELKDLDILPDCPCLSEQFIR